MPASATPAVTPPAEPRRWFEKPALSALDRMPMLGEAMVDVARAWSASFCSLSAAPGEIQFKGLERSRIATVSLRRKGALLALVDVPDWQTVAAVQLDRAFMATVVEGLFGGDGEELAAHDGEPMTAIETRIADVVARQLADALTASFKAVLPASFLVVGVQSKPDWTTFGKPATEVFVASFALVALGRTVTADLLIPKAALDPLAEQLAKRPSVSAVTPDAGWSRTLEAEVGRAEVRLSACIDLQALTLGAIARLRPGDTIALPPAAGSNVQLRCENGDLFRCELGQSSGHYTVRIDAETAPHAQRGRPLEPIQARTAEHP